MFEQEVTYPTAIADDDDDGMDAAIQWSIQQLKEGETLTVWTHAKGNLASSPKLQELVSRYSNTAHATGRGATFLSNSGPVVMAWPTMEDIGKVARNRVKITALCVIAWNRGELRPWVAAAKPVILGDASAWASSSAGLDPVVEEAMKSVTRSINHNNTVSAGYEKDQVVSTLLALRKAGYVPDPDEVHAWALAHGWTGKNPKRLADYVRDINNGVTPRARSRVRPDYIEILRQQVADRGGS